MCRIIKNKTTRIGELFYKELMEIIKERKNLGMDKTKPSIRELTDLITKHSEWKTVKEDTILYIFASQKAVIHAK
jgi:hypothetical protein